MKRSNPIALLLCALLSSSTYAFSPKTYNTAPRRSSLLNAVASLETFDGTKGIAESTINKAANFMMGSFWGVPEGNPNLLAEQISDLEVRFGEIMGKRKLFSNLIIARGADNEIAGIVGVEVALLDLVDMNILNYKQSEKIVKNAVASLGPKERRMYKDSSIEELVAELPSLAGNYEAVAVLANLCVSPSARGMGLGEKLCSAVEDVVSDWGMGRILLKVEGENVPAKKLYEKLGFVEECTDEYAITLRPDLENGCFKEIPCSMLTLSKSL